MHVKQDAAFADIRGVSLQPVGNRVCAIKRIDSELDGKTEFNLTYRLRSGL